MADETEQRSEENPAEEEQGPPGKDAEAQLAEMRDRMLRALAEAENTRRRAERDRVEVSQYAIAGFARDMLQIADNFSRALSACPMDLREAADPQVKAVIDGVEAIERQLHATLEHYGVKLIDTTDAKFDPNLHQAIAEVPGEGKPPGTVINVVQTGYMIGDRLLRPAMVTVARKDGAPGNGVDTKA
jgi:molecular chaperone GrpE